MLTSDMRKLGLRLLILVVLVTWLALLTQSSRALLTKDGFSDSLATRSASQTPIQNQIKIIADQLPADEGLIPIEIQQMQVSSSASNQIDSISYLVRNNTSKKIKAFVVARTITYEENGTKYTAASSDAAEFELHPDFAETSRVKSLSPGESEPMESSGAVSFGDGTVIKEVRLRIDYVQFDDGSVLGQGSDGERQVTLAREGAARYKAWLKERYVQSGRSLNEVLTLLQTDEVPEELGLTDSNQILGARNYRLRLLRIFQTDGPDKVKKYLNR